MRNVKNKEFKFAYLVNHNRLKRIDKLLKEINPEVEYRIKCRDLSTIQFSSLDELIEFPNSSDRRINRLEIKTPWESNPRINVAFTDNDYSPVQYEISGDDKDVVYYSNKIEEILYLHKQWYSKIRFLDFGDLLFKSYFIFFAILVFYVLFSIGHRLDEKVVVSIKTNKDMLIQLVATIVPFLLIFFGLFLDKSKKRLFPIGVYEIGEGIERNKRLDYLRNLVFVGIGLSILIGVFVNLIT